jgi:hypothetical protein
MDGKHTRILYKNLEGSLTASMLKVRGIAYIPITLQVIFLAKIGQMKALKVATLQIIRRFDLWIQ